MNWHEARTIFISSFGIVLILVMVLISVSVSIGLRWTIKKFKPSSNPNRWLLFLFSFLLVSNCLVLDEESTYIRAHSGNSQAQFKLGWCTSAEWGSSISLIRRLCSGLRRPPIRATFRPRRTLGMPTKGEWAHRRTLIRPFSGTPKLAKPVIGLLVSAYNRSPMAPALRIALIANQANNRPNPPLNSDPARTVFRSFSSFSLPRLRSSPRCRRGRLASFVRRPNSDQEHP